MAGLVIEVTATLDLMHKDRNILSLPALGQGMHSLPLVEGTACDWWWDDTGQHRLEAAAAAMYEVHNGMMEI